MNQYDHLEEHMTLVSACTILSHYITIYVESMWHVCLHPFRRLGEKIEGAYMPSWVLLSMTAVEERVRERKQNYKKKLN